ncbi:hypothetical protein KOW79_018598 [Hemibagrus wyckioides]|uniref:Uncharacterized protein n=1 Tax=Hemibagrus wyckioides TaxID=337641 RepID=A0A9D3NA16_9TELE|nr:serine/arginine repetitive matrix protein 2 [Hemibagrus wyckioides]KAG7317563.1 hypothetical protein KOW79_018598 [Hemibagrus wyckioides]
MSTLFPGLKSKCFQSEVKLERGGSASVGNSSPEGEQAGAFRDARRKKRVTRASSECIQTSKNLHFKPGALLKSKGEWVSTEENSDEGRGQLRFTSSFSLRFPSTKRSDPRTNVRVATKLKSNDRHTESDSRTKVADVHRPKDFLVDTLRESTGKATKDEDVSDSVYSWESHEHDISSRRSSDGIQRSLALCDQPAENCTQGQSTSESVTKLRVNGQESVEGQSGVNDPLGKNAEGKLSHSNLIPFREDTGSKADSDCQDCACSPTAINQTLSLPSVPDSHCVNNLKSDLITSTAAMFTSTLVSVLAPHWSGRIRRHKRVFSDAGPDIAQNTNLPALSQNEQQRFPSQQIQAQGEPLSDFSNRFRGSAGTRRGSVEWQNESFSRLSEANKPFLKSSALRMNRHATNQTTELGNPRHMLLNSGKLSRSSLDLTGDRGEYFTSLRSRPTTSTLLLSSRRSNSRKPSAESFQMEKQSPASVGSLDLHRNSIMRISQTSPSLVSPNDLAKETLVTRRFLASPDTHKADPSSPRWGESDSSRKQRYVITGDFDMINRNPPATNNTTRERLFSNYSTRFKQSETLRSAQDHGPVDRSMYDNKNMQNSKCNIPERSAWISPKENANSRFVFPEVSSNPSSDSILKRQISQTSMTSMNLGPSFSVQSNSINNMINSTNTSTLNGRTSPGATQSMVKSSSVSLSPASQAHTDQNNIQNSSVSTKPPSSPVNSIRMRTFTESLSFSPRKESSVEGTSPSPLWSNYLNTKGRLEEMNQSPLGQSSPLSPSEFKPRRVCTPSIYKYLRQTSPPQASPALSSPSPRTSSLKQKQEEDKNSKNVRFTFDLNSLESHDPLVKADSSFTSAPKSLPPDTGRRSVPRISKSPYATLIYTRAAANNQTSPPVTHQHSRSYSYDSSPVDALSPRVEKRSYTSVVRDRLSQRTSPVREPMRSTNIQLTEKTHSICQYGISESSTDAKSPDCQTTTLSPDITHPKQTDSVIKNIPCDGLNGIFVSQVDRVNTYATDRWNSKELSLPLGPSPLSDIVQKGEVTETLKPNGTFQASQSPASKWSFFSLKSKKDNVPSSSLSAEKEGLAEKKGEMKGLKSTNKVDQVLNRLRVTFGRISEDSDTSRRKTKKEEASNVKAYESIKKEKESADLTVKRQIKPEELLENKASESTRNLDQMDDLRVRTKPKEVSDIRGQERIQKPDQIYDLVLRTQTKPEQVSDIKGTEIGQTLDLIYDLVPRTQTKPEEVSDIKGPEGSQKLDKVNDLTVRTRTKPEDVSDIKGPQRSQKIDQMDLTVRRKTKNEMLLGDMPYGSNRNVEQRLSLSQKLKSPNSPNAPVIESCGFTGSDLGFKPGKQVNSPNMDEHKRLMEDSRRRLLGRPLSPNRPKPEYINCYATLPLSKRSRLSQSPTLHSPFECPSEEEQNDNVFYSSVLREKINSTPLSEHENAAQPDKTGGQNSTGLVSSSPFADLKYGLQRGRSVSVCSVVSGRPSGPGRISTGSRQGSASDLSSLDSFVSKSRHSSINSPAGSPENDALASVGHTSYKGWLSSEGRLRSPDNVDSVSFSWDMETDPTPPHSPPQTRRISQISSSSSASNRNSPDSLSPRGFLPSKNYKSTLSAFEESGSETTTDDEYYLNSDEDDEKETEL